MKHVFNWVQRSLVPSFWLSVLGGLSVGAIALSSDTAIADLPSPRPMNVSQSSSQQPNSATTGGQVQLNGRTFSVPWAQWQTAAGNRIGMGDAGLLRTIGVQLTNTNSAAFQPISWFTPSGQSAPNLQTRLTPTLRYLDITDLARQFGWQLTPVGTTLQITTPSARVLGVRQSKQTWGDRLVIELDRPVPWQSDPASQELVLSVDAQIDPALISQIKSTLGNFVQSIRAESVAGQTRLRIGIPSEVGARVWSLAAPNRIVVDVRPDNLVEQNILWANGVRWRQQILTLGNQQIPTVWLEVNPKQAGVSLQPILPNAASTLGTAPLAQTAAGAEVAGAINGGFFNRNRQLPLGAVRRDGRWLSGPILDRGAIAWDASGVSKFGRLTLQETITTQSGQRFPLTHLNSGYLQAGIARYTTDWGTVYASLSDGEIIVFVQNDRVTGQQTIDKAGASVQIPSDGYILVLRSNRSAASAFSTGTVLQLQSVTTPADFGTFPAILGAGPLLIQNRQIVLNPKAESFSTAFETERAARSAIAQTADGTLLLVAAHRRLDGSGLSLLEMAQLLQGLGAIDALNLDGGSSTTLYLGGQLLDRSPRTAARVHNAIGIFLK